MWNIKTPCRKCGKKKMIKSKASLTPEHLEIRVLNRCYKCGWDPPRRYVRLDRRINAQQSMTSLLIRSVSPTAPRPP